MKFTEAEIMTMLMLTKDYHKTKDMSCVEKIYKLMTPGLAGACASVYSRNKEIIEYGDMMSMSFIGVFNGVKRYKFHMDGKFYPLYLFKCALRYMREECRKQERLFYLCTPMVEDCIPEYSEKFISRRSEQLRNVRKRMAVQSATALGTLAEPPITTIGDMSCVEIITSCKTLNAIEKDVLIEHINEGKTFSMISTKWGKSRETIRRIYINSMNKLRDHVEYLYQIDTLERVM